MDSNLLIFQRERERIVVILERFLIFVSKRYCVLARTFLDDRRFMSFFDRLCRNGLKRWTVRNVHAVHDERRFKIERSTIIGVLDREFVF